MGYLGVPPQSGFITTAKQRVTSSTNNYVDLDNSISSLADVIVWVNSVKQDSTNLTLTTSTRITLGDTLTASDVVEIAYLGKAVATQTPDTGTVTNDMLAGSIANSKLANSSITLNGSAVSLGGSASVGKVLQVLTATDTSERSTTSTSMVTASSTLSVDITPASTGSKFFIQVTTAGFNNTNGSTSHYTIYRDSTDLGNSTEGLTAVKQEGSARFPTSFSALDSPNTTSQITYTARFRAGSNTAYMGTYGTKQSITVFEIGA